MKPITVSIVIYDEVEVLDACGPFEVFSVANRVARQDNPGTRGLAQFLVRTVAAGTVREVTARGGLRLTADHTLEDAPAADVVIVPGGVTSIVEKQQSLSSGSRSSATRPRCCGRRFLCDSPASPRRN